MKKPQTISVSVTLGKRDCETLRRFARKAWASGGRKLPHGVVIRALCRLAKGLRINLEGVRTEKDLLNQLREADLK